MQQACVRLGIVYSEIDALNHVYRLLLPEHLWQQWGEKEVLCSFHDRKDDAIALLHTKHPFVRQLADWIKRDFSLYSCFEVDHRLGIELLFFYKCLYRGYETEEKIYILSYVPGDARANVLTIKNWRSNLQSAKVASSQNQEMIKKSLYEYKKNEDQYNEIMRRELLFLAERDLYEKNKEAKRYIEREQVRIDRYYQEKIEEKKKSEDFVELQRERERLKEQQKAKYMYDMQNVSFELFHISFLHSPTP